MHNKKSDYDENGETLTGEEHEGGRGREVGRGRPPASDDSGREGHEHEEEGHDEERDHGASHVWKKAKNQIQTSNEEPSVLGGSTGPG